MALCTHSSLRPATIASLESQHDQTPCAHVSFGLGQVGFNSHFAPTKTSPTHLLEPYLYSLKAYIEQYTCYYIQLIEGKGKQDKANGKIK